MKIIYYHYFKNIKPNEPMGEIEIKNNHPYTENFVSKIIFMMMEDSSVSYFEVDK